MSTQRREFHAASTRVASPDGLKQVLMNYRGRKFASVSDEFTFKEGMTYSIVRAISARINQNYDGWPSEELKKSYKTFLGKPVFVNHANHDYKKARGKVVAARYVEAGDDKYIETVMEIDSMRFPKLAHELKTGGLDSVSMGVECFVPGTQITLGDGTTRDIEKIVAGDEVLTHTGRVRSVVVPFSRAYDGLLFEITPFGQKTPLRLTPEHPVWVLRGSEKGTSRNRYAKLTDGGTTCTCGEDFASSRSLSAHLRESKRRGWTGDHRAAVLGSQAQWIESQEVRVGDWVLTPRSIEAEQSDNSDLAVVLGYYLAEGNIGRDRQRYGDQPRWVEWTFNLDETDTLVPYLREALSRLGYDKLVGPYSYRGHQAASWRVNSPELAEHLVALGGSLAWAKRIAPEVMSWSSQDAGTLFDCWMEGDGTRRTSGFTERATEKRVGKTVSQVLSQQLYLLAVRGGYSVTPPRYYHPPSNQDHRPYYAIESRDPGIDVTDRIGVQVTENGVWRRVTGIRAFEYSGNVYNFEVDEDNSYVAENVAVHNCAFTRCSICDHKAVDVPDFCAHVKYHKGQTLPHVKTGKPTLCYEKCFKLGFFELSYVFDPADETAVVSRVIAANNKYSVDINDNGVVNNDVAKANWESGGAPESVDRIPQPTSVSRGAFGDMAESGTEDTTSKIAASEDEIPMDEIVDGQMPTGELPTHMMPTVALEQQIERLAAGGDGQDFWHAVGGALDPNPMHWLKDTDPDTSDGPTDDNPEQTITDPVQPKMNLTQAALERRIERLAEQYSGDGKVQDKSGPFAGPNGTFPVGTQKDKDDAKDVCNMPSVKDKHPGTCEKIEHMSALERRIHVLAYGESEAPEDVDTLRDESQDDTDDWKHFVESPQELRAPNLDRTQQLDRDQESQGLDNRRRVEQVEDVRGQPISQRPVTNDDPDREEARAMGRGPSTLVDPRTGRRYYAADDDDDQPDFGGSDDDSGADDSDSGQSDEDLLQEAEEDLGKAQAQQAEDDDDDDYDDEEGADADDDDPDDDGDDDAGGAADEPPPWLKGGDDDDSDDDSRDEDDDDDRGSPRESRRRRARRNTRKGRPMSLSQRNRVASAGRRRHYADESGDTDGGPYGENNQGEKEDTFISQTPSAEAVAAPTPGDGTISNTENNLVASRLRQRIQARNAELRRDLIAYEQITGQRIGNRRYAEDDLPDHPDQSNPGTETPKKVDPTVDDAAGEKLTGVDFTSVALDGGSGAETQPKDASVRAFRAFDNWLHQATGRTARQHGNPNFIRRSAAQFCKQANINVEALFPTLGIVLREARKNERSATMRRRADESLEVAAPQDRIDVEAPVKDDTDAKAQASQFDLKDFGDNAGDSVADPDMSTDSQIWAPGEGDGTTRDANRKADGITAVRYAEAFIQAGLAPNTSEEKWKLAGLAQTMRHATIVDRIRMLDAVNSVNRTARRTVPRNPLPQGFSQRQLTASTGSNDVVNDSALFLKG